MKTAAILATAALITASGVSCKKDKPTAVVSSSGVTGSEWFSPVSGNHNTWEELSFVSGGKYFRTEIPAPEIKNGDIENAVILVYGKLTGYDASERTPDHIGLLPTTVYRTKVLNSADDWTIAVNSGRISVRYENTRSYYPGEKPDPGHSFRFIIIPKYSAVVTGQKPTSVNPLGRYSESELRSLSYDQICETAGIKK